PIPTAGAGPFGITSGPGGYLWFMEKNAGKVGRATTSGVIAEFPVPSGGEGITGGSDGNIWFTEDSGRIGSLTPTGPVTECAIPSGAGSAPTGIVGRPDGDLWFVESGTNKIGKITTGALFAALPVVISSPGALGSFFKTSSQLHNPTDSPISGRAVFHPG